MASKKSKAGGAGFELTRALGGADPQLALLIFMLRRVSRINETLVSRFSGDYGEAELLVLTVLLLEGAPHSLSPSALCRRVIQTPGGMTKTLQRLEDLGLVQRRREEADRRALSVMLTAAGKRAAQQGLRGMVERYGDLLSPLGAADRQALLRSLRSLLNVFEAATGTPDSSVWLTPADKG